MAIAQYLDFTIVAALTVDLTNEYIDGKLDFIQSVWIDNADNNSALDLTFAGGPTNYRVRAQANSQGWYPVTWPKGAFRMSANSNGGVKVNILLTNFAMPYLAWAPAAGAVSPTPIVNQANSAVALGIGDTVLVAAIGGKSVKVYRGMFEVDGATILKWTDGPGGAVLFAASLAAGGSSNFAETLIPWLKTSAGNALVLNSSAAVNLFGGFGFVQS